MRQREANVRDIKEVRRELNRLRIITNNLERILDNVENEPKPQREETRRPPHYVHQYLIVRDINGVEIFIGDTVNFVSRGLYNTTSGIVYRFSALGSRVIARDSRIRPISRAPHNLRVVLNQVQCATKTKGHHLERLLQLQFNQARDQGKTSKEGIKDQPYQTLPHTLAKMNPLE